MISYRKFFKLRCRGLDQQEIANKLNIHRVTVNRRLNKLKNMSDKEFNNLYNEVFLK